MATSRHLRNLEKFSFSVNSQIFEESAKGSTFSSGSLGWEIYLDGVLYNLNEEELLSGFASEGVNYVKQLEGSFILFIRYKNSFYILTDKLNSRKAYYAQINSTWFISNDIDKLPTQDCRVSIDGIANYIANGVMLNGLTVFNEIRCAERSAIHCIEEEEFSVNQYWDLEFSYSSDELKESDYQEKFEELLVSCIKRRYEPEGETALSLSAGYDARGILGILCQQLKVPGLNCYSYALKEDPDQQCDAYYAKQLAEKCQYSHEVIISYHGDFIQLLFQNAREGKCLTNFSDELDAWHNLAAKPGFPDLFVGDMNFGVPLPFKTIEHILERARIVESEGLKWMKRYIPKETYRDIRLSVDTLIKDILQRVNRFDDPQDKMDYLYLDQRINFGLLTWRENICTQAGFVHMPYLDGELMDFIAKLPPHLRHNKQLYRVTISDMLPDLFSIPFASSGGYKVDWTREIIKHKKELIKLIQESPSRLDEFISGKELIAMIRKQNSTRARLKAFSYKAMRYVRRRIKTADVILGKMFGPMYRFVSSDILIIRLLLLRIYLSDGAGKSA